MYIRWKEKKCGPRWGFDEHHIWRAGGAGYKATLYIAYLVESKRRDGKPRQRTMYLASIRDGQIEYPHHRLRFWQSVQKKIHMLNLSVEQQQIIKTQLLKRVPDVTREQREEANRRMDEAMVRLHATMKARV